MKEKFEAKGNYNKMDSSWKKIIHYDLEGHYLCNRKCSTFSQKRTLLKTSVTCSQCILRLKKNEERKQEVVKVNKDFEIKENIEPKKKNYKCPISQEVLNSWKNKIGKIKI